MRGSPVLSTCRDDGTLWMRREGRGEGIARLRAVKFGRRRSLTDEQSEQMRAKRRSGAMIADLMAEFSASKSTVYRALQGIYLNNR